ncbi:deoxyribonuclease V [Natronospira bacteriovora]|uniref:Endonuclease V n=1 Tax=Natronospira bacteriovora TaxID=3069753 RepID=A0ABU0W7N4_9GAMM|nr:deoxyribonuclease V [Natronospira sp. AB-CW4]MDQ2070044.1 deoxyribonuclease V [Natronospira sp. AB-CW4]
MMNRTTRVLDHRWDLTVSEAIALQRDMATRLILEDRLDAPRTVAGLDVAFPDRGATTRAAVVVMSLPGLERLDEAVAEQPTRFPYVPGLLSFREVPALMMALEQLKISPQLLLCDGQGIAHPRRMGVACHLGLLTDLPSIGIGKSRLLGTHARVDETKGSRQPLIHRGETIGIVLRSRDRVRPILVSPGHRLGLQTAVDLTLACLGRFRLPEPIRAADHLAGHRP